MDDQTKSRHRTYRGRRNFMRTIGAAGLGVAASTTAAASSGERPTEIDSPTVIEEPGEYELVADLAPDELDQPGCIVIGAENVTLYGNDHTIDLTETEYERTRMFREPNCIAINPEGRQRGVMTDSDWETAIENVTVRGGHSGIYSALSGWWEPTFTGVTAIDNERGITFYVEGGTLEDCHLVDNRMGFVLDGDRNVWGGSYATVANCTIQGNGNAGVVVTDESYTRIESSRIVENGIGIRASEWSTSTIIEESHICRNEHYGVEGGTAPAFDEDWHPEPARQADITATGNYWGAANGPSSFGNPAEPFTDPETGRPADGDGDAISQALEPGVAGVRFDPFSESPFDDVGATR